MASEVPPVPQQAPSHRKEPVLSPPAFVLNRHGSRILDPDTAVTIGKSQVRPTVYVGANLLVETTHLKQVEHILSEVLEPLDLKIEHSQTDYELIKVAK